MWATWRRFASLIRAQRLGLWDSTLPARASVCLSDHAHDDNYGSHSTHTVKSTTRAHKHRRQEKLYPRGGNFEPGGEARTHAPPLALSARLLDGD